MSFWKSKTKGVSLPSDPAPPRIDLKPLAPSSDEPLALAKPPAPKADPIKSLDALREMKRDAGQITFYIYDRGQCFSKGAEAVLAMVNMNGCAAHYMINSQDNTWEFFQMPHLNTEKRACFRMGYASTHAMHEHLFSLFDQHLEKIGWNERHQTVSIEA